MPPGRPSDSPAPFDVERCGALRLSGSTRPIDDVPATSSRAWIGSRRRSSAGYPGETGREDEGLGCPAGRGRRGRSRAASRHNADRAAHVGDDDRRTTAAAALRHRQPRIARARCRPPGAGPTRSGGIRFGPGRSGGSWRRPVSRPSWRWTADLFALCTDIAAEVTTPQPFGGGGSSSVSHVLEIGHSPMARRSPARGRRQPVCRRYRRSRRDRAPFRRRGRRPRRRAPPPTDDHDDRSEKRGRRPRADPDPPRPQPGTTHRPTGEEAATRDRGGDGQRAPGCRRTQVIDGRLPGSVDHWQREAEHGGGAVDRRSLGQLDEASPDPITARSPRRLCRGDDGYPHRKPDNCPSFGRSIHRQGTRRQARALYLRRR